MAKSARYMKELKGKLDVGIIEASSLSGLSQLATVGNIDGLRLAGNFPDLDELRSFKRLPRLDLIGGSSLHLEPVGSLTQLRELVLQQPHYRSPDLSPLGALVNLEKFSVYGFALSEIPALRTMKSLKYLDLTDTPVADLSMLRELPDFNELVIDQRSIPILRGLAGSAIKTLQINHTDGIREPIDLSPLAALQKLTALKIMASTSLTLAPLVSIAKLSELTIWGTAVSFETFRDNSVHLVDPASIGELHELKRLELAWVDVTDTRFMVGLGSLEEAYLDQLHSLSDIRGLDTLNKLRFVQLVATNVVDIRPLLNVRGLKTLVVQVTPARNDVITELKNRGVLVKE
jgi:Leucine-rich repeat (LRR) protein